MGKRVTEWSPMGYGWAMQNVSKRNRERTQRKGTTTRGHARR